MNMYICVYVPGGVYKCSECGRSCDSSSALKIHVRSHHCSEQRPFECSVCSKTFMRLAHLDRHSIIHTGHKPHKCFLCGKVLLLLLLLIIIITVNL